MSSEKTEIIKIGIFQKARIFLFGTKTEKKMTLPIISTNLKIQSLFLTIIGILTVAFALFISHYIYEKLVELSEKGAIQLDEVMKQNASLDKDHKYDTTSLLMFLIFRTTQLVQ